MNLYRYYKREGIVSTSHPIYPPSDRLAPPWARCSHRASPSSTQPPTTDAIATHSNRNPQEALEIAMPTKARHSAAHATPTSIFIAAIHAVPTKGSPIP